MKNYIVHVSDARTADSQTTVEVPDNAGLSRVAQIALEEVEALYGDDLEFPVFLDIHPAEEFAAVSWMHEPSRN